MNDKTLNVPTLNSSYLSKQILGIAIPSFLGFVGLIIFDTVNILWVGKLGSAAVSGFAAACQLEWVAYSIMNLSNTGCNTLVAQNIGAKNFKEAHRVIVSTFWLSIIISIFIMIIYACLGSKMFPMMGLSVSDQTYANEYFKFLIILIPLYYIHVLQMRIFEAYGDTITNTILFTIAILFNIILAPILMFGWFGLPAMGVSGTGLAIILSEIFAIILKAYFMLKKGYIPPLVTFLKFDPSFFKRLLKIGIPTAATTTCWNIMFILLSPIITRFGSAAFAGINVAIRIEGVAFFFCFSFMISTATLVGQNFGAGNKKIISKIIKQSTILVSIILLPISLIFILMPEQLISLINSEPSIIQHGASYLRIVGYLEIFLGWETVAMGAFNGLGNTKPYMFLAIPATFARIPLAYLMAITLNFGASGVWWAISSTTLIKGILGLVIFKYNKRNQKLLM